MTLASLVAAFLWLGLVAYAVLAGADFGGGVWDAFSRGRLGQAQREAITEAMGPVWEANHVWLIFVIVGTFTCFPLVFASAGVALYLPLTGALIGIVLRGAAFAFRGHQTESFARTTPWGAIFGAASIVTPAFFGASAAALASGAIRIRQEEVVSGPFAGWTSPFAILLAVFAVSLCAYLAATFLMMETREIPELRAAFRRRALIAGVVAGGLALMGLAVARLAVPTLWEGLSQRATPVLALALGNGLLALWAVLRDRPAVARILVAVQIALVMLCWSAAQWPFLIVPDLTLENTAAPDSTLAAFLVASLVGTALLLPSLYFLFRVFKGRILAPAADELRE
jgi:cytochrome d ubiquinol oxidase subunit II